MASRHLFLVTGHTTFGEALTGLSLARALHDAGDYVVFLYPSSLSVLFERQPFRRGELDLAMFDLHAAVHEIVTADRIETIILVDILSVTYSIGADAIHRLRREPARVVGLDLWNLPETELCWDVGDHQVRLDPIVLDIPALRPCPLARPSANGAYNALPAIDPLDETARRAHRGELGVAADTALVVATTGAWQQPDRYRQAGPKRLASALPGIYKLLLARLPRAHLLHVGPQPFAWGADEPRYTHVGQLSPQRFHQLLGSADLMLSLNLAATSIAAAIALDVPTVVVTAARGAESAADAALPVDLAEWLATAVPLRPFRVCPIGLHALLEPVIANNPYRDALSELELLDLDETTRAIEALLADRTPSAGRAQFRAAARALPSALTRFRELTI